MARIEEIYAAFIPKKGGRLAAPALESAAFLATYVVRTVTMVVLPVFLLFMAK